MFVGGNGVGLTGNSAVGGYNGGGYTVTCPYGYHSGSGGGMTHISTTNNPAVASKHPSTPGKWNPEGTIAVAGGGGGYVSDEYLISGSPGHAGGTSSNNVYQHRNDRPKLQANVTGSTQIAGYAQGVGQACYGSSAGGGGWWGGSSAGFASNNAGGYSSVCGFGGAGGTGYAAPEIYDNCLLGKFPSPLLIGGAYEMPRPEGGTEFGHNGPGRVKITLIEKEY